MKKLLKVLNIIDKLGMLAILLTGIYILFIDKNLILSIIFFTYYFVLKLVDELSELKIKLNKIYESLSIE